MVSVNEGHWSVSAAYSIVREHTQYTIKTGSEFNPTIESSSLLLKQNFHSHIVHEEKHGIEMEF